MLKPQYSGIIRAIWYMLVPWHLSSSGHHQPRYWLNRKNGTLFSMRNGFNHQCPHRHCEMVESANTFYISWSKFCMKIVVSMETGHGLLLSAHMSLGTCKVGIVKLNTLVERSIFYWQQFTPRQKGINFRFFPQYSNYKYAIWYFTSRFQYKTRLIVGSYMTLLIIYRKFLWSFQNHWN